MSFVEFLGFIITLVAMAVLVGKKTWEERDRRNHPEKYKEEENSRQADLKKLLKSMDIDLEEEEEVFSPPPKPVARPLPVKANPPKYKPGRLVGEGYTLSTSVERRELKSAVEERAKKQQKYADEQIVSPEFLRKETDAYDIKKIGTRTCKGKNVIRHLHSKKDMMILYEIINKPKAF